MAQFFITRPVFSWVIAIAIMLMGILSITTLPVSQYPAIAPPSISISATYSGASAKTVEDSVTQIIEQNMTSLDGLMYFSSTSDSNGDASLTLTFENGTDIDTAQVQVQNKLSLATAQLPTEVTKVGITVSKASSSFLMVLGFVSDNDSMDQYDIADYVVSDLYDTLSRLKGVGSVQVFGAQYALRIWLDPGKLETYRLTVSDVISAIQAQNAQVAVGELGGTPPAAGQQLNATINAQGRMQTADQFRQIVIRSTTEGSALRLADIARVELGSQSYSTL
ncbi:MAG: multidrug efflux RND transporter permease subunit, partial [Alcaligenaceae bacterium]|nr:multidrug efflux RND transporter permease subunit [Alcaligenaceae bacterium]